MLKPKWWILNLKGEWNLINPQPSLDEDEFDVAFKLWVNESNELPAFYNQYDFYYELTDVPVDTLTLTLDAAKKFQEKGLLKLVKSYHRRKFKGKCKQKL